MPKFTIIDNPRTGYELHKADCRDLKQPGKMRANIQDTNEADSVEAFLDGYFDAEMREMGWDADMCRVFPCCGKRG